MPHKSPSVALPVVEMLKADHVTMKGLWSKEQASKKSRI